MSRSQEIVERAFPLYKNFIDNGFDPNDVSDIIFSQLNATYDEVNAEDMSTLIKQVENYYSIWDRR